MGIGSSAAQLAVDIQAKQVLKRLEELLEDQSSSLDLVKWML
jgi:hypothetical protein